MTPINLNRLAYFAAVVDTGSFTGAAERLGITKAVVSQQVARLEAELKISLLVRTTRRVEPTEAGRRFHARCAMLLREAEDALLELAESQAIPTGLLRIAATNDFGTGVIAPLAARYLARYPDCEVELVLSDRRTDLIAEKIDVSIRVGWLTDSSLQARRIGAFRQILVASPDMLSSLAPDVPAQLASLPFIANSALAEPLQWRFTHEDLGQQTVRMRQVMVINATTAVLEAALANGGLTVLPDFVAEPYLRAGRLVHILPQWSLPVGGIHAVYPAARYRPPKVTAFVAMLVDTITTQMHAPA